jgi:hypothetical protein
MQKFLSLILLASSFTATAYDWGDKNTNFLFNCFGVPDWQSVWGIPNLNQWNSGYQASDHSQKTYELLARKIINYGVTFDITFSGSILPGQKVFYTLLDSDTNTPIKDTNGQAIKALPVINNRIQIQEFNNYEIAPGTGEDCSSTAVKANFNHNLKLVIWGIQYQGSNIRLTSNYNLNFKDLTYAFGTAPYGCSPNHFGLTGGINFSYFAPATMNITLDKDFNDAFNKAGCTVRASHRNSSLLDYTWEVAGNGIHDQKLNAHYKISGSIPYNLANIIDYRIAKKTSSINKTLNVTGIN